MRAMWSGRRWCLLAAAWACTSAPVAAGKCISDAVNEFSLALVKALPGDQHGNVAVSPLSAYTLLGMLLQGSRGASRLEVTSVLHASPHEVIVGYLNFTQNSLVADSFPALEPTGLVACGRVLDTLPRFFNRAVVNYVTTFAGVFHFAPESLERYEAWITSDSSAVTEAVAVDQDFAPFLSFGHRLALNSSWGAPPRDSSNFTFRPAPGQQVQVPALYQEVACAGGVSRKLGVKWVHIKLMVQIPQPPEGSDFRPTQLWSDRDATLLLILPTRDHGLEEAAKKLKHPQFSRYFSYKKNARHAKVLLPEFKLRTANNLAPAFKQLGLHEIFKDTADLGGITKYQLKLSRFYDRMQLNMDKYGVRTGDDPGRIRPHSSRQVLPAGQVLDFTADQPFLYFILDQAKSVPILAGKVANPAIQNNG